MPSNNPSTDNPSTLATMFSRMKSQLTSTSSSSGNDMTSSNSMPASPAAKQRSKIVQPGTPTNNSGTPSKIPVHVDRTNYQVPPSPSRERERERDQYRGSTHQSSYTTTSSQQTQQTHSGFPHPTGNNPMPPPPQMNAGAGRSLHPRQDAHLAQAVSATPQAYNEDADIHMTTVNPNLLPAGYLQSLANQPGLAGGSTTANVPMPSIAEQRVVRDDKARSTRPKEDVKMQTVLRSGLGQPQAQPQQLQREEQGGPQQLALWEREILASQEVKRKVSSVSSSLREEVALISVIRTVRPLSLNCISWTITLISLDTCMQGRADLMASKTMSPREE